MGKMCIRDRLWTLQFHLLSQYKSAQPKGRINDKYPDVLPIHALPQFLDAATGGKAVRDGPAQQVFVLFKKASTLISSMPKRMLSWTTFSNQWASKPVK